MHDQKREAGRKLLHLGLGILLVVTLQAGLLNPIILLALILLGLILSILSKKHRIPILYFFLKRYEREQEIKQFPGKGLIYYIIGAFIVVSLFPKDIASAAIMILALGEPASYTFGIRYGKLKHPFHNTKYLEGLLAGIVAGFIGAFYFVSWQLALAGAFFAMVAESIELRLGRAQIDDNIVIPLVSATVIFLLTLL